MKDKDSIAINGGVEFLVETASFTPFHIITKPFVKWIPKVKVIQPNSLETALVMECGSGVMECLEVMMAFMELH